MKRKKNKNLRRALGLILMAALVGGLAAMPLLTADKVPEEEFPLSILSAKAERKQLLTDLRSGGTLSEEEAVTVTVPGDVKLTGFLVRSGDAVKAGDPIASVDRVTVMAAIAEVQETMDDLAKQLEQERTASSTDTLKAPGGLVKKIYAQPGDSAEEVMRSHGALATLSLDGLMMLEVTLEGQLPSGQLTVQVGEEILNATVTGLLDGTLTVTFQDKGFEEGTETVLLDASGNELGRGSCAIHAPWNAVAYSGTVSYVYIREDQTLYKSASILALKDIPYSAEYRSLAAQYRGYEEQMLELFQLYQSLTVTAPCDGVISGIDEDSAQLLSTKDGWEISLLANAPGEDPDAEYICFVGVVKEQGADGYIVALDPTLFSMDDYTQTDALPRDTAAMTHEAIFAGDAPVYRWDGKDWEEGSFIVGDLLLFGGDATGKIVWVVPYGSIRTPGEPSEPTEPSAPTDPTGPTEPEGGKPEDDEDTDKGDEPTEGGNTPGGNRPSGGTGGMGGGSMPSFSGYGNYGGMDTQQQEATPAPEVTIASVTPQETMTLQMPVDEMDLHLVRVGQEADVTLEALGATFPATVTEISRSGESSGANSKFTVTLTLQRQADMLPGMNCAVSIPLETVEGITIPVAALRQEGSKTFVYTAQDPETGEPTGSMEVKTGFSDGEYVLVEDLAEGTEVWYTYYEALEE